MKTNIIFCISYLQVPITISIAEKSDNNFLIIIRQQSLYDFFIKLYPKNKLYILPETQVFNLKLGLKNLNILKQIQKSKNIARNFLSTYKNQNIYFFSFAFCEFEAYLVHFLSKKNHVFYSLSVNIFSELQAEKSIYAHLIKFVYLLLYKTKFDVLDTVNKKIISLNKDFSYKIKSTAVNIDVDNRLIQQKINKVFHFENKKILFLTGAVVEDHYIEEQEFIKKNDELLQFLENKFDKNSISLKIHPRFFKYYSLEKNFEQIEKSIPANILLNSFNIIIGYDSSVLFEAANNDKIAISLLNYFTPINAESKQLFIAYLKENLNDNKTIHFPNNLQEISKLLKS